MYGPPQKKVNQIKPGNCSFSAFVRTILTKEVQRRHLQEAALHYEQFLQENPDEQGELEAWHDAPLTKAPKTKDAS